MPDATISRQVDARVCELYERHRSLDPADVSGFYSPEHGMQPPEQADGEHDRFGIALAALDAIDRGGPTRRGTVRAFFSTFRRDSVLGRYSIDYNGDTTLQRAGVYRIAGRRLVFDRVVDPGS